VIVRTGHSVAGGTFPTHWPALSEDAAQWLVQHGLTLWGVDAPSVDRRTSTALPVHNALFGGGAFVLENLALDAVPVGRYELLAQPLAVHGADAAPVRALLRTLREK
jgi:arylformamidase